VCEGALAGGRGRGGESSLRGFGEWSVFVNFHSGAVLGMAA
jgi:hypothetical protein